MKKMCDKDKAYFKDQSDHKAELWDRMSPDEKEDQVQKNLDRDRSQATKLRLKGELSDSFELIAVAKDQDVTEFEDVTNQQFNTTFEREMFNNYGSEFQ